MATSKWNKGLVKEYVEAIASIKLPDTDVDRSVERALARVRSTAQFRDAWKDPDFRDACEKELRREVTKGYNDFLVRNRVKVNPK